MRASASECVDFGRSFINGTGSCGTGRDRFDHNDPRFWIESVVRLFDDHAGTSAVYYQCASCKAENTFTAQGAGDLFVQPNYDFLPVFGPEELLVFRRPATVGGSAHPYKSITPACARHTWGSPQVHLVTASSAQRLETFEQLVAAAQTCLPIVGKTAIQDASSGLRAEIEYPIKTLNIHYNPEVIQIDTGPVLYPDLSRRYDTWAEALSLAFVAFESRLSGFADFILEAPVPIQSDDQPIAQVLHYSKVIACPAHNSLWSLSV